MQVVIVGDPRAPDTRAMLEAVRRRSLPDLVLTVLAPGESLPEGHPAHGKGQAPAPGGAAATAYVCQAMTCSLPVTDPAGLGAVLDHV